MNETWITRKLKDKISKYFLEKFNIKLLEEFKVSTGIADLAGTWYDEKGEARDVVIVEIKQSAADLKFHHGHNFVGTSNYLAVPTELVGETLLYLRDVCDDYNTGVIKVTKGSRVRIVKYPRVEYHSMYPDLVNRICHGEYAGNFTPHIYKTVEAFS